MTNKYLSIFILLITMRSLIAQEISPYIIGQNAHMPDFSWGRLSLLWDDMDRANFGMIRIGGKGAMTYAKDYEKLFLQIDGIRSATAEPIVQVPHEYSRQQVIDYVTHINVTSNKNIKYWSIGNEPLHNNVGNSQFIADYLWRIGSAIKEVDPDAIVMGPDYAWYNGGEFNKLLGGELDITGVDAHGNYPIDYMVWHQYGPSQVSNVEDKVDNMLLKLAAVNQNRPADKQIGWAIGEINTHWDMDQVTDPDQYTWSFHAGQLFAEIYDLGMRKGALTICPWSMAEGRAPREGTDLGIFEQDDLTPRATYWHSYMLGQNIKQNYLSHTESGGDIAVVSMGDDTGIAVMLLNKSKTESYSFKLQFNMNQISGSDVLVNIDANLSKAFTGNIGAYSTQMFVFSPQGTLVKKYTYTSIDADNKTGPLIEDINQCEISPQVTTSITHETCGQSNGTITFSFPDQAGRSKIEFSTDDGATYPTNVNDSIESITLTNMAPGTYEVWSRWGNDECPVDLGSFTINAQTLPIVNLSSQNSSCGFDDGSITFSFDDDPGRSGIEFSIDDGVTYPQEVEDNFGSFTFNELAPETYHVWTRWGNTQCPVDLGTTTIEESDCQTTSLQNPFSSPLKIYPNPTFDYLYSSKNISWELRDILGGIISEGHGDFIDLTMFAAGVYFVKAEGQIIRVIKK